MTTTDWIAFWGLVVAVCTGGSSALAWLLTRMSNMRVEFSNRLTRIETILELAFPEAKEQAQILDSSRRVKARRGKIFGV